MIKAFAYLRVSSAGQVDGDGFPRQIQAVKTYAAAHDLRIIRTFKEQGVSGAVESMNRPAWCALMVALQADGVRMVVIEKLDRLARDLMIQETIIADLQRHGFTLLSVAEPDLMAADPTRILMRQLMGAVAQYDKAQIVLKLRAARQRMKAKTGRCEGRLPYGTKPGEPAIIDRMKALRSTRLGVDRIAEQLNADGLKPRSGAAWYGTTIANILRQHGVAVAR
jgi:DNA invertase Pin-like site-specific DNA recombinase